MQKKSATLLQTRLYKIGCKGSKIEKHAVGRGVFSW